MEIKEKALNILYLRSLLDAYGVSKILLLLAEEFKNKGHNIIIASDNNDKFKTYVEHMGIRHYTIPLASHKKNIVSFVISFIKLIRIVKKEEIDIIHSHHRWSSFIGYFVSKMFGIPLVTTYHGIHKGNKFLTIWGDKIISVSEDAKNHLIDYFHVKPENITVIKNGIKLPELGNNHAISKMQTNNNPPVMANIARMSPEKDQKSLFLAMKKVIEKHPEIKLLIVGDGPLENELINLARELGIQNNVKFLGEVEQINAILSTVDFVVLSSLTEGLPMAVLEALAFEKPVIATRVGDIATVVKDGQNGFLVPPGNSELFANAIIALLEDKERMVVMGKKGRQYIQEHFDIRYTVQQTENIYFSLLPGGVH
jgi:glycosyltransferase involved in cell wall biosynthesis